MFSVVCVNPPPPPGGGGLRGPFLWVFGVPFLLRGGGGKKVCRYMNKEDQCMQ